MSNILNEYNKLTNPNWYLYFQDQLSKYFYDYDKAKRDDEFLDKREEIVRNIVKAIKNKNIGLGENGVNFDLERKSIDTIVIHMTSTSVKKDNIRDFDYLNALDLIRLYCYEYSRKKNEYYSTPIFSGHYYNGIQTFIPYHYLIEPDGNVLHILKDEYIGWHAGNWDTNCRSIAIAFLGNFINSSPSNKALQSARKIIKKYKNINIVGHREICNITKCPGNNFKYWKENLI